MRTTAFHNTQYIFKGDYFNECERYPLKSAQFVLTLQRPFAFPPWQSLWDASFLKLNNHLHQHIQLSENTLITTTPLLFDTDHTLKTMNTIFEPTTNATTSSRAWRIPTVPKRFQLESKLNQILTTTKMTPLPLKNIYTGKDVPVRKYNKILDGALVDITFAVHHLSVEENGRNVNTFSGHMINASVLGPNLY